MRLIQALHHWWLVRAARRDMRSAAYFVTRAENRLKAAGLSLLPLGDTVVPSSRI